MLQPRSTADSRNLGSSKFYVGTTVHSPWVNTGSHALIGSSIIKWPISLRDATGPLTSPWPEPSWPFACVALFADTCLPQVLLWLPPANHSGLHSNVNPDMSFTTTMPRAVPFLFSSHCHCIKLTCSLVCDFHLFRSHLTNGRELDQMLSNLPPALGVCDLGWSG